MFPGSQTSQHLLTDGLDTDGGGGGGGGGGGEGEWNPLLCYLCQQTYREPCLLACYHTFCAGCLRGRSIEGKLACPICGFVSLSHQQNLAILPILSYYYIKKHY